MAWASSCGRGYRAPQRPVKRRNARPAPKAAGVLRCIAFRYSRPFCQPRTRLSGSGGKRLTNQPTARVARALLRSSPSMVPAPRLSARRLRSPSSRFRAIALAAAAAVTPTTALAHERFVKHDVLQPFPHDFFFHVDHNVVNIAVRVFLVMAVVLFLWFRRHAIEAFVETKLRGRAKNWRTRLIRQALRFLTDRPLAARWFERVSEWTVIFFLRSPGLVLMYAAANSSLVMPTYPLAEPTKALFQYASVALGIAIITQLALPLCGAAIFAIFGYIVLAYDWKLAVDVLPVLSVAVVYVTCPWRSHVRPITTLSRRQVRLARVVLGFSFFALGWMKIYNPDDVIGVAQNFPTVTEDLLIKLFYCGTDPALKTGCWLMAFALSEVLCGFLVMAGVFSRVWALQMVYVFTKLMLVDFGWPEIPHLYPIGVFLLLAFSNQLSNEPDGEPRAIRGTRWQRSRWGLAASAALAWLIIFPLLYALTLTDRPFLRASPRTTANRTTELSDQHN